MAGIVRAEEVESELIGMGNYSLEDVARSYKWLGHENGFTELSAFHKKYRRGE